MIGRCLDKLLAMPSTDFAILVIDDGSDDGTSAVVGSYDPERVWLLRRSPPYAREGKGLRSTPPTGTCGTRGCSVGWTE